LRPFFKVSESSPVRRSLTLRSRKGEDSETPPGVAGLGVEAPPGHFDRNAPNRLTDVSLLFSYAPAHNE
jgi:hypothetical protein